MAEPTFTSEQRRALLAAQAHGLFTKGRKGWHPGFTTNSFSPFKAPTMQSLVREGWLEKDILSGRLRLTDRGRLAAASVERERVESARRAPRMFKPSASAAPVTVRLPYADN